MVSGVYLPCVYIWPNLENIPLFIVLISIYATDVTQTVTNELEYEESTGGGDQEETAAGSEAEMLKTPTVIREALVGILKILQTTKSKMIF